MPPLPHPVADARPVDDGSAAFRMSAPRLSMPQVIAKRADFLAAARSLR